MTVVDNSATFAVSGTTYKAADGAFLGDVDNETGEECFPDGPQTPLPPTAEIGDFGFIGRDICTGGDSGSSNWRLDAHSGSSTLADLKIFSSTDSSSSSNVSLQMTRTIDTSGHTVALAVSGFDEDGISIELD